MIEQARKKMAELGLEDSLHRRFAKITDVSVTNVIYADRSSKKVMKDAFDLLDTAVKDTKPKSDKVVEMQVEDFIKDVIPKAESLEVMLENSHENNLVSLIAPEYTDAKNLFKWDNPFSFSYKGEVTDSMKDRVKGLGGNVEGDFRFSIQWNEGGDDRNDLDAHCIEPNGNRIYHPNKGCRHPSSGMLDVDIVDPKGNIAVENIIHTNKSKMPIGIYKLVVHNYSHRGGRGGVRCEIEFNGEIFEFNYNKNIPNNAFVEIAQVELTSSGEFKIIKSIPHSKTQKEVWNISTQKWTKVSTVMNSPNYWDGKELGNKHYFFMLEGCKNPDKARGFYNEFLTNELTPHRKVFEVLASKMKAEPTDDQLSGVGFSSTQRNSLLCKVSGSFNRVIKVNF
jgi:hypothetical protein